MTTPVERLVTDFAQYAAAEVNQSLGLPEWKDQSSGNQCHALTYGVMQALQNRGIAVRRELHGDDNGNWHYLLAHGLEDSTPGEEDLLADFNPWQWRSGTGDGLLHMPRHELMEHMRSAGAPEYAVALRSLATIVKSHEPAKNYGGRV